MGEDEPWRDVRLMSQGKAGVPGSAVLDVLEALDLAAAVVDADARIIGLTQKLHELPELRGSCIGRHPRHSDRDVEERIRVHIRAEFARPEPVKRAPLVINGRKKRPLLVQTILMQAASAGGEAVMLFFDLEASPAPSPRLLRHVFGLTNAEARVASRLAAGEGIGQLSRSFGISVGTVRQHLKSVFSKTGCRRQAELLATLARLTAVKLNGEDRAPIVDKRTRPRS